MQIRSLTLDWPLDAPNLHRDSFFGRPSLSAFDLVFIDPVSVSRHWTEDIAPEADGFRRTNPERDRGFGRTLAAWMTRRRTEAGDLLKRGGGILVCRLRTRGESLEIVGSESPGERIDRYGWLPSISLVDRHHQFSFPSNGRFVPRHGEDVVLADTGHPFEEYLRQFAGHIVYDAVYQDLMSTPIDRFATVLARNRVGDVLAVSVPFDEGRLILVPPIEGVSPLREATVLHEAASQLAVRPGFVAPPDWLPGYPLPGEEGLVDELASLTERRDTLAKKIEEITEKLDEKTGTKRILYTKGRFSFLPAVADSFRALGFTVEPMDGGFRLTSDEGDALVVAEASEEAKVGVTAYRRLRDIVDRSVTDGDPHHKGILVVSGSRELDPKRRPTQFSAEVLRGCSGQGFCLVSSYQLHKLVQASSEDRSKKSLAALRRGLLECDGELRDTAGS
ncbi:MAG: hypothetical protein WBC63_00245 [Candidatus Bipolaricaulia bacterium]